MFLKFANSDTNDAKKRSLIIRQLLKPEALFKKYVNAANIPATPTIICISCSIYLAAISDIIIAILIEI